MEEENVQQPGEQQAQLQVSAVQIELPPFWPKDPALWFAQVEAQFRTRGVTVSKTKFDYVVSCLDPEFATEVRDLLLNPPAEEPYEALKAQLTKQTSASEQRRLQELLSTEELGDRTLSKMLGSSSKYSEKQEEVYVQVTVLAKKLRTEDDGTIILSTISESCVS